MNTPNNSRSMTDEMLDELVRQFAVWRVELVLLALPTGLGLWLYVRFGLFLAIAAPLALVTTVLCVGPLRRFLGRLLHRASVRRHLETVILSLPGILAERRPRIHKITRTTFGDRVELVLWRGTSVDDLVKVEAALAASLGVRQVRCVANAAKRNLVTLTITRDDPFNVEALRCPLLDAKRTNLWDAVPVGVDEDGEVVALSLPERNVLLGGEPGAGKSVALSLLVAAAALDPEVDLWLFDGKVVELSAWSACARDFVGHDAQRAITVLEELTVEMDARYHELLRRNLRKVTRAEGLRLHVVVIDELALYVAGTDKKSAQRFAELLRDLVARGRAAGIIVLAATQKPSIDIVPSTLRDLFGFRWALRCATRDASDTVLGAGWASEGFSASNLNSAKRGVGLLLHEGGVPVQLRTFHLTDDDVRVLAERARQLRLGK
ncbi:MAG: FtsK/SpoIIIE domain-containing protein [Acidimicrobiales bacterium]